MGKRLVSQALLGTHEDQNLDPQQTCERRIWQCACNAKNGMMAEKG